MVECNLAPPGRVMAVFTGLPGIIAAGDERGMDVAVAIGTFRSY
jgi:hypothetical protein